MPSSLSRAVAVLRERRRALPAGEFVRMVAGSLFRDQRILVYGKLLDGPPDVTRPELDRDGIRKGNPVDLEMCRRTLDRVPWELQCDLYDGVEDCFVWTSDGIIGHISWLYCARHPNRILRLNDREGEVKFVLTFAAFRGNGLFTATLRVIERYLREKQFRRCFVCVEPGNTPSIRSIEKAGFHRLAETRLRKVFGLQISRRLDTTTLRIPLEPACRTL